ncbi:MAG: hypothetical protein AAGG68_08190 [Bacteroidota bacterium]
MNENYYQNFINKLIERYGAWQRETASFGSSSYGKIAEELCVSSSQFSKLISDTATEGMYIRSIKNIEQLQKASEVLQEKKVLELAYEELQQTQKRGIFTSNSLKIIALSALLAIGLGYLTFQFFQTSSKELTRTGSPTIIYDYPLGNFFDGDSRADYVSPYLNEQEVQEYCPCSGYEGVWKLESEYKIPIPGRKPGVYYVAKSADTRIRCMRTANGEQKGKVMLGFESLHHEIWVDKKRTPLSSKYFDATTKTYTAEFANLKFEDNPQFAKVANIYSFFFDEFTIYPDRIERKGEPCGRYSNIVDPDLADQYEIDLKHILQSIVGNMTSTVCESAINENCNPNDLQEGLSTISFDCLFTINAENLGIGGGYPYTKGYQLVKQNYSANLLCACE